MLDIGNFKSKLKTFGGPVPVNRYVPKITFPTGLNNSAYRISERLQYMCQSCELPGRTVNMADTSTRIYGPPRKIPYNTSFVDTSMQFMVTQDSMQEKRIFDDWVDLIQDIDTFDMSYYDDLVGEVNIQVLNEKNALIYECILFEAFPQNVSVVTLSMDGSTDFMKFTVTMAYRKWKKVDIDSRDTDDFESEIFDFNPLTPVG